MGSGSKRVLHVAFDAFGTLFKPSPPIAVVYGNMGRKFGLEGFSESELNRSFKSAFKAQYKEFPNYGKTVGMMPKTWWTKVIEGSFSPFVAKGQSLPDGMVPALYEMYQTRDAYELFGDVAKPTDMLARMYRQQGKLSHPSYDHLHLSVISNCDDRIEQILTSLNIFDLGKSSQQPQRSGDIEVLSSYEAGVEKPDSRIFEEADRRARRRLAARHDWSSIHDPNYQVDSVYIGDDLEKDYLGAINAGWRALLVIRDETVLWNLGLNDKHSDKSSEIHQVPSRVIAEHLGVKSSLDLPGDVHVIKDLEVLSSTITAGDLYSTAGTR